MDEFFNSVINDFVDDEEHDKGDPDQEEPRKRHQQSVQH